jgi:protein-S-isoprenylcysteine O-methyltransferase Ste14
VCDGPIAFLYLGALLLGLAAERFVTLRSFGIDWRLLVTTGALLFVAGAAMMLAAAGLFRRLGTNVPPSQPTTLIATTGPYRWTRNPMYLGMALIYAGLAIGFDGPIAFALLPLVLIAIQTQVTISIACWAMVHGLATLIREGTLARTVGIPRARQRQLANEVIDTFTSLFLKDRM